MSKQAAIPNTAIQKIVNAAKQDQLIVVIGAGVSKALTNGKFPSWRELIDNGLTYAVAKGRMQTTQVQSWRSHLASSDIDDLLSCAEFLGRKLGAPSDVLYERWLQDQFKNAEVVNLELSDAIQMLSSHNIPICTLNYDHLLESVTGLPLIPISDSTKTSSWFRRELKGILHLHGSFDDPKSCVLGIRDYEKILGDDVRNLFQRHLATFNQLLLIGCGDTLSDPNFSALITWMRQNLKSASPMHYALTLESELSVRHQDPVWAGFVEPISYGSSYNDLAYFIQNNFPSNLVKKIVRKKASSLVDYQSVIKNYQNFLIRDCGQMTIEGVSADMETGQRKFELERLFVPLNVSMCPPEFSKNDPEAQFKLDAWHKKSGKPIPFGECLNRFKHIALLALPGGGKTLLLKRLAVAYADSSRRSATSDALPDLDLLPVLIRCREWRDYIKKPIFTLLKSISDITGQTDLFGFSDALLPYLKKGKVILLVDGLDEIHNDADRTIFVEHLESFLESYPKIRLVVTSREAGFNLVAPTLSRFCERLRIAPLEPEAISLLSAHWHRLMVGDSPATIEEGREVAAAILNRSSLRRLAENPLLLTMLLVVKHGAGGLPPDRVSLYSKAVEVLLDTWNIKGHEPLNMKEAVPQLAFVAYHMLCSGKQTATENELLSLLEEAREELPNINRYAKDSPHSFLKRVELRSSLLIEAGYQLENGKMVPFYQFRHLTFQEYLAAVAVTEGRYKNYSDEDNLLTPLQSYILSDEWKEVIPMAAVLAKKQAEPLLISLISKGENFKNIYSSIGGASLSEIEVPNPIPLITQCIVEEIEASTETINSLLHLIAYFWHFQKDVNSLKTICKGPYGRELYIQSFSIFQSMERSENNWVMNDCAEIAVFRGTPSFWLSDEGRATIFSLLSSQKKDEISLGLLTCMGMIWASLRLGGSGQYDLISVIPIDLVHMHLVSDEHTIWGPAMWTSSYLWNNNYNPKYISPDVLDFYLNHLLGNDNLLMGLVAHSLASRLGLPRNFWCPILKDWQIEKIIEMNGELDDDENEAFRQASFFIAYHAKTVWSDKELLFKLRNKIVSSTYFRSASFTEENIESVFTALGGKPIKKINKS